MDFETYQDEAFKTEQAYASGADPLIVPMLGLAGEAGELLSEYKKRIRDGAGHANFEDRVAEELGDLLWYIANIATKFKLKLSDIAQRNLDKVQDRWGARSKDPTSAPHRDAAAPKEEQIPRQFEVVLFDEEKDGQYRMIGMANDIPIGDPLTDNAYVDDGYRFHDVFHLAYAATLGWSPVTRYLLGGVKRKYDKRIDEVEDGARAIAIEEAISAMVAEYAENQNWLEKCEAIDYPLLRTIRAMTAKLEVKDATAADWQRAIFAGFNVWRELRKNSGGVVKVDLDKGTVEYIRNLTPEEKQQLSADYPAALERKNEQKRQRKLSRMMMASS